MAHAISAVGNFGEYTDLREELTTALIDNVQIYYHPYDVRELELYYCREEIVDYPGMNGIMSDWEKLLGVNLEKVIELISIEREIKRYKKLSTKRLVGILNSTARWNFTHIVVKKILEDRPRLPTKKNKKKEAINRKKKANKGKRKEGYRARMRK